MSSIALSVETGRLQDESYLSARVLSLVFSSMGRVEVCGVYSHLRQVDNRIDVDGLRGEQGVNYVMRQWDRVVDAANSGQNIDGVYTDRLWSYAPKNQVLRNLSWIYLGMAQDAQLSNLEARTGDQRNLDFRSGMYGPIQLASLFLTQRELNVSKGLIRWMQAAYLLGNMKDLKQDVEVGQLKMPFNPQEQSTISSKSTTERMGAMRQIFDEQRFSGLKWRSLQTMFQFSSSWKDSGLPSHLVAMIRTYNVQAMLKMMIQARYPWSD